MKVPDGFVSIGHLLANKTKEQYVQTLRHFCTVVFCNLGEDMIHKSTGFYRYDQFFSSVDANVESFAKFVGGILRHHEADAFDLQLAVERLAWDLVKYDYDRYASSKLDRKTDLFRLFCVFNRFCCSNQIPMTMPEKAACFIFKEIGVPLPYEGQDGDTELTLEQYFQCIHANRATVSIKAVKRLYDEHVRDVIKEGRVKYRVVEKGLVGQAKAIRTVTVTSRRLIVHEDDGDLDCPHKTEPKGTVEHKIPLIDTETKVLKGIFGKSKMYLQLASKSNTVPMIEMVFDQNRDHFDLYSWSQAIQEAVYSTQANTSRLAKTYLRLGLDLWIDVHSGPAAMASHAIADADKGIPRRSSEPLSPELKILAAKKKPTLDQLGRSTSETLIKRQSEVEPEVFTFAPDEDSSSSSFPSSQSSTKTTSSSRGTTVSGQDKPRLLGNLPAAFQRLKSRSSSSSSSTNGEEVDAVERRAKSHHRISALPEQQLVSRNTRGAEGEKKSPSPSWLKKTGSSPALNITRTF